MSSSPIITSDMIRVARDALMRETADGDRTEVMPMAVAKERGYDLEGIPTLCYECLGSVQADWDTRTPEVCPLCGHDFWMPLEDEE